MSHDNGIAGTGRIRLLDNAAYPANEFFQPGREFSCRCRFATISYHDDARLAGRGASLKFADTGYKSPLDLLMNTGKTTPFWNVRTFWQFMKVTMKGRGAAGIPYMSSDATVYVGSKDLLRSDPGSFANLHFHSKVPYTFSAYDGIPRYVKFRMVPWEEGVEAGLPDAELLLDWEWCWQGVRPGEERSRNYLKDEFKRHLAIKPMRFRLDMQLHDMVEGESRDVIHSGIEWEEATHPWIPVAEVTLDRALDYHESNTTLITLRNRPKCLGLIRAQSIDDPAGMNYLRQLAIWPRRARLLGNRIFGMPKPFPDQRDPKDTVYTPFLYPQDPGTPIPLFLPQDETPVDQSNRRNELNWIRQKYPLTVPENLPSYISKPPEEENFSSRKKKRMFHDLEKVVVDLGISELGRIFSGHSQNGKLSAYDEMYPLLDIPPVHKRWREDVEFARQRLAGVNPTLIEICERLPENFPVTDSDLHTLLPLGSTLSEQMAKGRVYITNYAMLDGLKTSDAEFLAAPMCLFHVADDGTLLPLAIQLEQDPEVAPIFTPNDSPWLWLAVKTYAQSADAAFHEIAAHLLRTHLILEPIYLCARRNLSPRHPLMELLAPHFKYTLAINHAARTSMLTPGGALPQAMATGYDGSIQLLEASFKEWTFKRFDIRHDLENRGVLRKGANGDYLLPNYYYRDDALANFEAIEIWVDRMVDLFYESDEEVMADYELQAWVSELADPQRGNMKGLPGKGKQKNRSQLKRLIANIIYTASAEHSSVNNGQYDYFGYIPNVPGAMHKPPPRSKEELSEKWLVEALPGFKQSCVQLAMVHLLSEPTHHPLGLYPESFFAGHVQALNFTSEFRDRMDRISTAIRKRNLDLEVPYTFLDPRQIAQSTAI